MPQHDNCMGTIEYRGCYINWKASTDECKIVWPDHTIKICASMRAAKLAITKAQHTGKIPALTTKPTLLSDLPVIVTGPGWYTARNGWRIHIHAIEGNSTYACKGHFYKPTKKGKTMKYYSIWHVSGRYATPTGSPLDILTKDPE